MKNYRGIGFSYVDILDVFCRRMVSAIELGYILITLEDGTIAGG